MTNSGSHSYITELLKDGVDGLSELFNINPDRVDLVAFPAIGRKFLLVKANFSNRDWSDISESDYTIDQLVRAVPSAIREWAKSQAEKEGRDIVKSDLKLRYKDPNGSINVNGVKAARSRISQVEDIPQEIIGKAGEELDSVWEKIQSMKINKEDNGMNEIVKSIEGYIGTIEGSGKSGGISAQLKDILKNIKENIQNGNVKPEDVSGLLDELNAAFDGGKTVSKSFFANWSVKSEPFAKSFNKEDESSEEVDEKKEDAAVTKSEETSETVNNDIKAETEKVEAEVSKSEEVKAETATSVEETPVVKSEEKAPETSVEKSDDEVLKSIKAQLAKAQLDVEAAREEVKKANEEIQKARDEKMRAELVSKSTSELSHIGKSANDMADLLIRIKKSGVPQTLFDEIYGLLKSASEMIDKSGFFVEKGIEAGDSSGDPDEMLMKSARDLVKKGEYKTVEQAYTALLRNDPSILSRE